jgi:DNA replication protein DnaC
MELEFGTKLSKVVTCANEQCWFTFKVSYWSNMPDLIGSGYCDECVEEANKEDRARREQARTKGLIDSSEIPKDFHAFDREVAEKLGTMELLKWLSDHRNKSLVVRGDNQQGKSHTVGFAAYRAITQRSAICLYLHMPRWLTKLCELRSGSDRERSYSKSMIKRATNVPFLIMDDIGNGKITPAKIDILWNLIDHRAAKSGLQVTWITSNHNTAALESILGGDAAARGMTKRIERMVDGNIFEV